MCFTNYQSDNQHQREENKNINNKKDKKINIIDSNLSEENEKSPKKILNYDLNNKESYSNISTIISSKDSINK
jgi:hypothetical protein